MLAADLRAAPRQAAAPGGVDQLPRLCVRRVAEGAAPGAGAHGQKAWELIDAAGCRGLVRGGAEVSDKHCNFMLNRGDATAADLEGLAEEVRRRVQVSSGVVGDWVIKRLGTPGATPWRLAQ